MICPKCYSGIKDGSKFCTNCGEPLSEMQKDIESSCKKEIPFYSYLLGFLFTLFIVVMPITIYADNYQQVRNTYNTRSRVLQDKSQQKKVPYYARPRTRQNNTQRNTPYYARPRTNQGNIRQNSQYNVRSGAKQENDLQQTQSDTLYNDGQYRIHSQYASSESSTKNGIIKDATSSDLKTIRLVVSGEGATKEEATKVALRSAIEQTFGAFVSSNTDVLNDDIIKDEIATVSSGNIQSYKELSSKDLGATKVVNVETVVSIGNLISFAKSKGMKAELSGATFAMNMKMKELNKNNELLAISHLIKQLLMVGLNNNLYDFKLKLGEPKQSSHPDFYTISATVQAIPNKNAKEFLDIYMKTMKSLSLSESEIKEYEKSNVSYVKSVDNMGGYLTDEGLYKPFILRNNYRKDGIGEIKENPYLSFATIQFAFICSKYKFKIIDNLGNEITIVCKKNSQDTNENLIEVKRFDLVYPNGIGWRPENVKENDIIFVSTKKQGNFQFQTESMESLLLKMNTVNYPLTKDFRSQYKINGEAYYSSRGLQYYLWKEFIKSYGLDDSHPDEEMRFSLFYKKEDFEKLSSIEIKPTSEMLYLD